MTQARKKPVLKLVNMEKTITSSIEALKTVCDTGTSAVALCSKEKQKLLTESKRLSKRKATLLKKKRITTTRLQKAPSVELRKNLREIDKELTTVTKTLTKINSEKSNVIQELSGLKENLKRANAYLKGVNSAERSLNKSRKRRKPRAKAA